MPPHTTDLLQPLHVSVFKSLKDTWGTTLFKRLHLTRSRLSKAEFASLLVSDDVWKTAFSSENITHGFAKCGIAPFNRNAYPKYRFKPILLKRYNTWVANGKPEMAADELDNITSAVADDTVNIRDDSIVQDTIVFEGRKGK